METKGDMKYYSQYRIHDLFELQESLLGLSKSNRWVKLADRLPWTKIGKEHNKRLRNSHCGAGNKPARMVVGALIVKHVENLSNDRHADMYINNDNCIEANDSRQQFICRILHIHGRHCCLDVWQTFRELPDSRTSSTKRQVTPFLYIGSRPAASTLELRHSCVPMAASQQSRSGSENDAKIRFF